MKIITKPQRDKWKELLKRPYVNNTAVLQSVKNILDEVKMKRDIAVKDFTKKFDGVEMESFKVSEDEMGNAGNQLSNELKQAIDQAKKNIETFHQAQITEMNKIETMPGVVCWQKNVGIEKVGLYIPGGTAPLFSTVLMLGIPARLAGCKEIILCTPAGGGEVHPAILYTANLLGIKTIFKIGGAQAIAAMAYGTETIPAVYKIFGPGNQYVTTAKQLVQMNGIAIDMPAGPSEVCVLADETADPSFVAADLLSQAEHGADSQVLLISSSSFLVSRCLEQINIQLEKLPRKEILEKTLKNSKAIIVDNIDEGIDLVNEYAAEHLIINCANADAIAERIINAGSVFIGNYSPESVGDYASGTNHTLPTNGFARAYSGVSVDSFVKKIAYQKLTNEGLVTIAETVITMAEAEGLHAHAEAVKIRGPHPNLPPTGEGTANTQPLLKKDSNDRNDSHLSWPLQPGKTPPLEGFGEVFPLGGRGARENILNLKPYSSARSEYSGEAHIFLDANENSFGSPLAKWYNRYPDPMQTEVKKKISAIKNVAVENMLLGNGSDECIDLLIRVFCEPKKDNIIICPPTYGMYEVCANINDVSIKEVPLLPKFQLNLDALEQNIDAHTKLIFLCSPNNPTGNSLEREDIELLLNNFEGLVVLDEAYINYSRQRSFINELKDYPNLVVLQTFSKAWGLAALRLGMTFASKEIINLLNKIKPPYNISGASQELALKALENLDKVNIMIKETVAERENLVKELIQLPVVKKVYPSDANFVLTKVTDANAIYNYLKQKGIIVRNRTNVILCEGCLRITVGTPSENTSLLIELSHYEGIVNSNLSIMRPTLKNVKALEKYKLFVQFDDGTEGILDLSDLAGKEAFLIWEKGNTFFEVFISDESGAITWPGEIDVDTYNVYCIIKGINPEDYFKNIHSVM